MTVEDALRTRYYIRVCSQASILQALDDLHIGYERVLFNCEPIVAVPVLDFEQRTVYSELQEIRAMLAEPIRGMVVAGCLNMNATTILNICTTIYDHDQLLLSHEVYYR